MLQQIIRGTPIGVWLVLAALVALGLKQTKPRTVGSRRAAILPAAFVVLSLVGVLSAFGASLLGGVAWACGVVGSLTIGPRLLPRIRASWQAAGDTLQVPGSWLPLVLILALFGIKYAAGVSLAMHPVLVHEDDFVAACSLAYGVFSGLFAARARQLWQVRAAARR